VKAAVIPGAQQALAATAPEKAASASSSHNQLQKVAVVQGPDGIEVEISSSEAVTPRLTKLKSPARLLVELPETVVASSQSHIAVGNGGVKGVRIGMDGKNPPTTSVVVDLEKALAYELTPGPAEKLVLTLHTQGVVDAEEKTEAKTEAKTVPTKAAAIKTAKNNPPVEKQPAAPAQPKLVAVNAPSSALQAEPIAKPVASKPAKTKTKTVVASPAIAAQVEPKKSIDKQAAKETTAAAPAASGPASDISKIGDNSKPKQEDKKWAMNGKRDPFFSPVVQQGGSGCSTGKKCLEIGNINLRGVVKSENGFIAVVTNNLNKAYFLRENDPVFNGYVMRITGDSVVFQETVQDKLGKPFTREIVKRIFTPAV
jgi:hypothetical protein